ncbi:hypothetical protein ABFX02_10G003900 [Erythranthe guttata]
MRHVNHHQPPPPCTVVSIRAKAKRFDLKLKSSRLVILFPFCYKLLRFSIRLKIHPYLLEIKSKPESSLLSKTKSLNLKFLNIIKNFRRKRHKNKGIVAHKKYLLYGRKGRGGRCIWLCALLLACFIVLHLMHKYYFVLKYIWKACRYGLLNHFFKKNL